ncbi:spore wall protein 2 [Toxotes jaculatrix]|uniref:spore wall protein 2 n=1 Tax=Toxotes jaculatrix TaxID=941984 RepID=UPI001B3AFA53|nr:spore wall protein 2 [Toxotes jaculatrix]
MLQQNNNNNYPCLNVSGSTREMLHKCSRASLPFPSRLELSLGDLPLIRGLRAWALCSKNRCKAGGLLGGGQAPTAPPAGRGSSTSCPRPADVYLSGEWAHMGYGLPMGLDARQAGIGALVTVATLKTSEGSGKTQTQCLFLRTEKGSCLYSTAKPGSGAGTGAASSVVGGWLRGKTGAGGRDTPVGRRESGPTLPAQTGANRVRVRSGRRWRKSGNAAGREKTGVSRERQQRGREDPAGERQEEGDKGSLDSKQFPSLQQDSRRARQEKEGACRSPRCCHNVSPKTCAQCGRRAPRRESQDEGEGGESPRGGVPNRLNGEVKGIRKEREKNEEEERGGLCGLESSIPVLAAPNPDLESNRFHPQPPGGCDGEEIREADSNEELRTQTSHRKDDPSEKELDSNSEILKIHHENNDFIQVHTGQSTDDFESTHDREAAEHPCEETVANVNGFSDYVEADEESEKEMERVDAEEEEESVNQTPSEFSVLSNCYEDVSVSPHPASISTAASPGSSSPVEGSICTADHEACWIKQENSQVEHLGHLHVGETDPETVGKEELDVWRFEAKEGNCSADENNTVKPQLFFEKEENNSQLEEREASSSALRNRDPLVFETENSCDCRTTETERRDELESEEANVEERLNPKEGVGAEETWRRECTCSELDFGSGKGGEDKEHVGTTQEEICKGVKRSCAPKDNRRSQDSADGWRGRTSKDGDACGETGINSAEENGETVACVGPSTSFALSLANPDPSLPPLGSMETGLPCVEEEEGGLRATAGDGGQEGKSRHRRELEEQGEEERGSTGATAERRKEEEEEDEFGVFMQAEGELAWSEGFTMSASVPCGSRESVALVNHAIAGEVTQWTPGWTDSPFHQSADTWTAFPQDLSDEGRDVVGQWWPASAVEERRDRLSANQNLAAIFAEAFPSLPGSSSSDLDAVPTLAQLLRGRASQDQGLLDNFHDLNKMIGQRYKRANGVSRDLLLKTLHLEQPHTESRPAPWTANRRLSPGLPSANQHAQSVAAKRRLSYDYNRNILE